MSKYRKSLPQLQGKFFLTDGGIETTLIFHEGLELPDFAAFYLLRTPEGEAGLRKYFHTYAEISKRYNAGLILESATWRANPDWAAKLGYNNEALADANRKAIQLLEEIRTRHEDNKLPAVISGCIGPRGDGYIPGQVMSEQDAEHYHYEQIATFATTAADMVTAITMNYTEEAIGITHAAKRAKMPVAISFTVETDGNLPTGQSLKNAIIQTDTATDCYPAYYMINCAHPTHFKHLLNDKEQWLERIRGFRANASIKSHAELNESSELDVGNPVELGKQYAQLKKRLSWINVMGGCCGTDHRHIEQIAEACAPLFQV
jgi:S-methylmethionine-dependent homocysteine/selenocysteine methylase